MEIPFSIRNSSRGDPAATRGGEGRGGVVKYKLPDRLGQTRSDNRSRAGGRATIPRRHPKFPAYFSPSPPVHGDGKLSAVFQTRSTSPFPSTLALLLFLLVCLATRERANILRRGITRADHLARNARRRWRRKRRRRRCTCIPWDWERTSLSARSFINIYPRLNPSGSSFSVSLFLSMTASSLSRFFFVSVSGSPGKKLVCSSWLCNSWIRRLLRVCSLKSFMARIFGSVTVARYHRYFKLFQMGYFYFWEFVYLWRMKFWLLLID